MEKDTIISKFEEFKNKYSDFIDGIEKVFATVNSIITKTGFTEDNKELSIYLSELKAKGINMIISNLSNFEDDLNQMEMSSVFGILDVQLKNSLQNTYNDIKALQEFPTINN